MQILKDILRVLGVDGQEAENILFDLHELAGSRGARRLVVQLPKQKREKLDEDLEAARPGQHVEIIQNIVQGHFSEQERQRAFEQALREIIESDFLPTIFQKATEEQRREIQEIVIGE